jgi:2-polyprenyl-6-methoxyphenol hydroxylase-like FAD-dependent oxidoreductase/very-short-patch-repair endonuclease
MKINIIGGGPAGMYFAILMKQAHAAHDITIYERNGPDDTFGWGVVFSGKTLANLREADQISHAAITRDFEAWDNVDVVHRSEKISIHGNSFSGIARLRLLKILQVRCEELGVRIHFRNEVSDIEVLKHESDLLIGADGVNSTIRQRYAERFQPSLSTRPNKYVWYGTHQLFHGLTLTFRENDAGVFAAHSYKFNPTTSTFIIECDQQTWESAGLATMSDGATREYLETVFARDLNGQELLSNNSKWINFVLVKNTNWHFDNVVLLGDALHTAHFSIGSGTKLAMEDAIALKQCFDQTASVSAALEQFEDVRKPVIEDYQAVAYESMLWFENARSYMHLMPIELAYSLMTRSGRVDEEELRKRDPEFIREYTSRKSNCFRAGTQIKTESGWKAIEEIVRGELVWTHANRLRTVLGVQRRPHLGTMIGLKLQGVDERVWVTPDQKFLSPSPLAERGLGGEDHATVNPTPSPSPRAGRGDVQRSLGGHNPALWKLGRQLKRNATSAEQTLWKEIRGKKLGIKFRRQHALGSNYIADFYAPDALLAIELDGSAHDSPQSQSADGIRHRQLQNSGVRVLRFRNERVFTDLAAVLREITELVQLRSRSDFSHARKARQLTIGSKVVLNENGEVAKIESIDFAWSNETVYDLSVEEDGSFVTVCGIGVNA